jgi:hypothetical protein
MTPFLEANKASRVDTDPTALQLKFNRPLRLIIDQSFFLTAALCVADRLTVIYISLVMICSRSCPRRTVAPLGSG